MNLNKMQTLNVYSFYDMPLVFTAKDKNGIYYFIMQIQEEDTFTEWFVFSLSNLMYRSIDFCNLRYQDIINVCDECYLHTEYNDNSTHTHKLTKEAVSDYFVDVFDRIELC